MERLKSNTTNYRIPIRLIVANTNPRNPLSPSMQRLGWTVFEASPNTVPLWALATSNSPSDRAAYVELLKEHDPEFTSWAATFITQGQLQPVEVRDNGKRNDGKNTYTLIFGCRRCLAILYNWCLLGTPSEPVVEARLEKGNNVSLMHRAIIENVRKDPNPIEVAQALKFTLNNGESEEELAQRYGFSVQTLKNRLALLDLPLDKQKKIAAGTLTPTKALQEAKPPSDKPKLRKRKEIEEARKDFADSHMCARMLDWILGKTETFKE